MKEAWSVTFREWLLEHSTKATLPRALKKLLKCR